MHLNLSPSRPEALSETGFSDSSIRSDELHKTQATAMTASLLAITGTDQKGQSVAISVMVKPDGKAPIVMIENGRNNPLGRKSPPLETLMLKFSEALYSPEQQYYLGESCREQPYAKLAGWPKDERIKDLLLSPLGDRLAIITTGMVCLCGQIRTERYLWQFESVVNLSNIVSQEWLAHSRSNWCSRSTEPTRHVLEVTGADNRVLTIDYRRPTWQVLKDSSAVTTDS